MTSISKMQMQCLNCKAWFDSPMHFADMEMFEAASTTGNLTNCPACGHIVPCNKSNIRFVRDDGKGGFVGVDTSGLPGAQVLKGRFENQTLENVKIQMEGSVVKGCKLMGCTLVFLGNGEPIEFGNNSLNNPRIEFAGDAARIMAVLANLCRGGMAQLIKPAFDYVLAGAPPAPPN